MMGSSLPPQLSYTLIVIMAANYLRSTSREAALKIRLMSENLCVSCQEVTGPDFGLSECQMRVCRRCYEEANERESLCAPNLCGCQTINHKFVFNEDVPICPYHDLLATGLVYECGSANEIFLSMVCDKCIEECRGSDTVRYDDVNLWKTAAVSHIRAFELLKTLKGLRAIMRQAAKAIMMLIQSTPDREGIDLECDEFARDQAYLRELCKHIEEKLYAYVPFAPDSRPSTLEITRYSVLLRSDPLVVPRHFFGNLHSLLFLAMPVDRFNYASISHFAVYFNSNFDHRGMFDIVALLAMQANNSASVRQLLISCSEAHMDPQCRATDIRINYGQMLAMLQVHIRVWHQERQLSDFQSSKMMRVVKSFDPSVTHFCMHCDV